jgi:PKD repeat protein
VRDTSGRTVSATTTAVVNAAPAPPAPAPAPGPSYTVTLAASPTTVVAGSSATLTATVALLNGATAPTGYAWDCNNDGVIDANTTTTNTTSCAYPTVGTATSKVTVTGVGATGSGTTTVTVTAVVAPSLFVAITANTLTPSLAAGGPSGAQVTFTATVTTAGTVPSLLQWQWDDTNDGTYDIIIASAASPNSRSTAYGSVGAKTVKVRVVDVASGREATGTLTITVAP